MFGVRTRIAAVVLALMSSTVSEHAATVPVASSLAINPVTWSSSVNPLSISASLNVAGNWKIELISRCTGIVMRTANGSAARSGRVTATFSKSEEPALANGPYEVRITPLSTANEVGTPISTSVSVQPETVSTPRFESVCPNARRMIASDDVGSIVAAQVLNARATYPAATTVIIAGYDKTHIATTAVTAVYARMRGVPLLFTAQNQLNKIVSRELTRRKVTNVVLVGSVKNVSATVEKSIKSLNISVRRVQATTLPALALKLYSKSLVAEGTPAVFVNYSGSSRYILEAAAFASASNRPLLPMSDSVNADVAKAVKTLKLRGGVAIGPKSEISDKAISSIPEVVRVYSSSAIQQSLVLARSVAEDVASAITYSPNATVDVLAVAQMMAPRIPIAVGSSGLTLPQRRFLNARGDVTSIVSTTSQKVLSDDSLASIATVISQRGATEIPILEQPDLGDYTAPATFGFSGSGFGHGIGLSQWGAYAMAKAGMTPEDIVTHYFPGTTLGDVTDSSEMHVGLQNRISKLVLKMSAVADGTAKWMLAASTGEKVTLSAVSTATFTYDAANDKVKVVIGKSTQTLPASTTFSVFWSGTRYASKYSLTDTAAKVQVIGPSETSSTGRWYRFGYLRIGGIPSSTASDGSKKAAGLTVANSVRLHDEYLYGLGEVPSSWPAEALQAQVIAARGYAYNKAFTATGVARKRMTECDCTIDDGQSAQVFVGWSKLAEAAGPRWKAAVDATATSDTTGQVVKFGDLVVQTFFSSASGGFTQNNQDVWGGTARSYWQGVDDPWSISDVVDQKIAAWQPRIRPQAFMAQVFGLSKVYYLDMSNRHVSGALRSVTAHGVSELGSKVSVTMSASNFRLSMGKDFNLSDNADPYDPLPSEYAWRLPISLKGVDLAEQTASLVSQRSLGFAQTAASKATTAVLVATPSGKDDVELFLASAFAAQQGSALYVVRSAGDATRIKTELQERNITSATSVGVIDAGVSAALVSAGISVRNVNGANASDLARQLATVSGATASAGVVLVSESESSAWPLAVSVAARARKPLLLIKDGALSPETAQWLTSFSPESITIVGTAGEVPDTVVAGFANASRLNTADLPLAALAALNFGSATVRSIVTLSSSSAANESVVVASLGLPVFYSDADTKSTVIQWLRRKSLVTSIVNVGGDPDFVKALRYA